MSACLGLVPEVAAQPAAEIGCRLGDEAHHALKLTRLGAGIRVDYEVVSTGERTWTNMNASLVRQFGVKAGRQFCMAQTKRSAEWVDFD